MRRFLRRFAAVLGIVLLASLAAPPATAAQPFVLQASGAQTGAGNSGATGTEIGNWRNLEVAVGVTAGSGTVTTFRVWLEGSPDGGATWFEIACQQVLKTGAASPGTVAAQRDIVNETAVQTSSKYTATCETYFSTVRAAWNIAGTTPSETFSVTALGK